LEDSKLYGANLEGANLEGAKGIAVAGPMLSSGRLLYANVHKGAIKIKAGCRYLPVAQMKEHVIKAHGADTPNARCYLLAIDYLVSSLELQMQRDGVEAEGITEAAPQTDDIPY